LRETGLGERGKGRGKENEGAHMERAMGRKGEEEKDLGKGIGEGYVGRKGEEEEDCGQGIGEGYVGRKGEEKEDSGKGIRGLNAEPQ